MPRVAVAVFALVLLMTGACSGDDDDSSSPADGTSTTSTTTSANSDLEDCPSRPEGSSPAVFDPAEGTYAAQSVTVAGSRQLRFDIVQWLTGKDANEAYLRETGDDGGPPNDYYVLNESSTVRTAPVAQDAEVFVLQGEGTALRAADLQALPTGIPARTFWLSFDDGSIMEICEQYRP